ncbi:hypothetical protein DM01DRAFT_1332415 [Hesseltinella vesiculosa]|uniref:ERCC4 domain-containing protein n=1 Tax=Hesseltinella vesiculosa TaxID=101127 RepID=A0A1X2GS17_9FUNG|nr:hypothetical protein DM01DRAFT_1332415 [Hesseltinella vesiculosa]
MLEYQQQILANLLQQDSLLIMSPGLGLFSVFCHFLQVHTNDNHLILLLNTTQAQNSAIQEHLLSQGIQIDHGLQVIEYDTPSDTRAAMYRQSGIFAVTSQILAVDLLLKRVPSTLINGIIIYNAHQIRPNSMEDLVLQIYRNENEQGFIKAFSDHPDAFTSGFAPLQNTLKILQLRHVELWPRFQVVVAENLSKGNEEVIELRQPMTPAMDKIQNALVECMETTMSEVRRANSRVDVPEYTFENALFKSFDMVIRQQLDPVWHQISPDTKHLVGDLRILRQLIAYLTDYDSITFNSFIETIIYTNSAPTGSKARQSQWLYLDAADRFITAARKRVFVKTSDPEYQETPPNNLVVGPNVPKDIRLTLEEHPKWGLLKDILQEIDQDATTNTDHGAPVLVMVNDRRTCKQLQEYLASSQGFLKRLAEHYFSWRTTMLRMQKKQDPPASAASDSASHFGNRHPPNKRRRVRGGSATASAMPRTPQAYREEMLQTLQTLDTPDPESDKEETELDDIMATMEFGDDDLLPAFDQVPPSSLVTIQCYENDKDELLLEDFQPRYIIMYNPDPAFIRRVEVYRAMNPQLPIRVYFMIYDNSVEEQKYLSLVRREKEAFERLIREKSIMAIPIRQKPATSDDDLVRKVSSRYGGGRFQLNTKKTVIVDMREFRSSLPPMLYSQGIHIVPCTLQVGDYILSPEICVERKSISDLIQSLSSGRLYTQCENMKQHYRIPILLIEFDQAKSFSLQNAGDIKDNIVPTDITSKLTMLTLSFPTIRIIWSSSPQETTAIFKELKESHEEPDAEAAAQVGVDNPGQMNTMVNATPEDILRSMPGINSKNYRLIMKAVKNLEELALTEEATLQKLIGKVPGHKLYRFIHRTK